MGGHTIYSSDTCSVSPVQSPHNQLYAMPQSTPSTSRYAAQDVDYFPTVARMLSKAPPSSPVLSPEHNSQSPLCDPAEFSSPPSCPWSYLERQLDDIQPQHCQGESLDSGCEQDRRRFSFDNKSFNNEGCSYVHDCRCHCSSHDDDSTLVDLSSRAESLCSNAGIVLEDPLLKGRTLSCYTAHKASLSYDYPELYPSNPDSLRHTMPSPTSSANNSTRPKPSLEAWRSYGLFGSPPVAARSRQISLPIINMPSVNLTTDPQMASNRAQSWHASPIYSPGSKPPKPLPEVEKSIFEDYDEENVGDNKLSNRFRHLIRRLHCG